MESDRTMPNCFTQMFKNIIIIPALWTCLSSCDVTVEKDEASGCITNDIARIVSHEWSQDWIDLSKQDSTLINKQVENIISLLQTRENTTDSTYTFSYEEIAYFALLIYHNILSDRLNTLTEDDPKRPELEKKRKSIENQLNHCDVHVVIPIEYYNAVELFFKQNFPSNTLPWPPSLPIKEN